MIFKLIYGNHNDYVQLYDTLRLIKLSIESCGHKVDLEKNMCPGYVNILIDNFTYDFYEVLKEFKKSPGTEFVLIATEYVTGETFNDFNKNGDTGYSSARHWKKRYNTFKKVSELSSVIWHLSENQIDSYRNSFDKEKVFYLPHGYIEGLETISQKKSEYKDIDVIFTGSMTPYREKVISRVLEKGLNVKVLPISTEGFFRDDMVARSKIALNIRQSEEWSFPSNSRFHYHLINKSFLLTEACDVSCDLSDFIMSVDSVDLPDVCQHLIRSDKYIGKALENYEFFKQKMPMKPLMEDLLSSSFE